MTRLVHPPFTTEQEPDAIPCVSGIGFITHISSNGEVFVDYPGNEAAPIAARVLANENTDLKVNQEVLLIFVDDRKRRPIVMGRLLDRITVARDETVDVASVDIPFAPKSAQIDGKTITLEAKDEIILKCGKSSITLRKNGKIIVQGTNLVSRASQANRIKGGTVSIN